MSDQHTIYMKNRNTVIRLLLTMALLPMTLVTLAQTAPLNITTTAVPFLSISPDARSGGMGDMGVATSPDAFSGMHNAAKAPFAHDGSAIGVNYTPWLRDIVQDMYLLSAAGYHKLDDNQALTAGLRYFNLGDVSISDYSGNKLSTSHPREYSLDLGYSRKLSERLGLGLTARYIHSDLGNGSVAGTTYKAANAVAADVSLYYDGRTHEGASGEGQGWSGGLVLSNLGSKVSYSNDATAKDYLPANLGLGLAYTGVADEDNRWTLGAEANKLLVPMASSDSAGLADYHNMGIAKSWGKSFSNSAYKFALGGEYGYKGLFFLRAGYTWETQQAGDLRYFTAGAGFRYSTMGIDFSYLAPSGNGVTRNPLSNTFRLGLVFNLPSAR
jgi:hypothetical protein